jgi:O-antigen/teichoic acid export membrane protein
VDEPGIVGSSGGRVRAFVSRGMSAAGIMLAATVITNGANYLYSLIMGRQLGPDLFGEFTALLGILMILSVATQSVQTVVARYVTSLEREEGKAATLAFCRRVLGRLTMFGIAAFAVWIPLSWPLAAALQIDSPLPVIAAGSALILGFSLPVLWGLYQGEQRFRSLGSNMVIVAVGRLLVGVPLVALGAGVAGAIGALTVSTVIAFAAAYPSLRGSARLKQRVGPPARTLLAYGLPTTAGLGAWTLLTNLDVVFVKALATSTEAGYYGAAATIGKIPLFLPIALGLVIFPKAAARHAAGRDSRMLMRRTGQIVIATSLVIIAVAAFEAELALRLMFGESYTPAEDLVVPVVAAMCCFALANVMLFYYLSIDRMVFPALLFAAVVAQAVALALFAADPLAAAYVQLSVGLAIMVVNEAFLVPLLLPMR